MLMMIFIYLDNIVQYDILTAPKSICVYIYIHML